MPGEHQIAAVAGTDKVLRTKLENRFGRLANVKIFGLVGNMHELMSAADVLVTKPGGLTISEALAAGVPMVLFDVICGQEEWNAGYLTRNGAAVRSASIEDIPDLVARLLADTGELRLLAGRAMALANPESGIRAARCVLGLA